MTIHETTEANIKRTITVLTIKLAFKKREIIEVSIINLKAFSFLNITHQAIHKE